MRRRGGPGGVRSAGGWGGGDAILSALERAGRRQSLRGRRVTWHSRTLNAAPEPPHQSPSSSGSRCVASPRLRRPAASEPALLPSSAARLIGSRDREGPRTHRTPSLDRRSCHRRYGPHHLLSLLSPLRQEADAHFDGWIGCCWQDDNSV